MAAYNILTLEDAKRIIICYDKGFSTVDTMSLLGHSSSTISIGYRLIKALRAGDTAAVQEIAKTASAGNQIKLFSEALGVNLPAKEEKKPEDTNAMVLVERLTDTLQDLLAAVQDMAKSVAQIQGFVLAARQENNEKLNKVVEAININGDIASKEHEAIRVIADSIKGRVADLKKTGVN